MVTRILAIFFFVLSLSQTHAQQRVKVDGVAAVVGENIVLESDVEKFKQEVASKSEGKMTLSNCEMLEEIMLQKLLAHQAVVDSLIVSEAEVDSKVERNLRYFAQQMGSMEKVVDFYGFQDEDDLRRELGRIEKEALLVQKERQQIMSEVAVTPEEVRLYFKSLETEGNLPEIGTEIQLAQIVMNVEPSEENVQEAIDKLTKIRNDVLNGSSLRMKAVLYSEDPSVTQNGGKFTLTRESGFVKEFKEVAFSLEINEISEPFESPFGYHIIQLEKVKGQERDVRHVLISPKTSHEKIEKAKEKITKIRDSIAAGELEFFDAVKKYSDDKSTKENKGIIINQQTNDSYFELTRMDPALYGRVSVLKLGEITEPYFEETRTGEKMFKMILMKNKIDSHTADFVKDYVKIQQMTLQKKQQEELEKWSHNHVSDTYVKIHDLHKTCDFKYNWSKE